MNEVTLNSKEQKRLMVLNELLSGRMTGQIAAEMLGLSLRHTRRLMAAYRRGGAAALAHGNRGRPPANRLPPAVAEEILRLARSEYLDYNDSHFTEELGELHHIVVSVPTVRRLRRAAGLGSPRKRRPSRRRRLRERYPRPGMLLQVDGSRHDWLEGRGPWLTLVAAIDDATNEVPWALFREEEDATGYALLLHHISQSHGLPLALYADRHTIFHSPKQPTLAEQLEGIEPATHLGRMLAGLQIRLISARSPQAKGRVERLFGTLQDRLVKQLRRARAANLEEANAVLQAWLPRFNQRFSQLPAQPDSAYQPRLTLPLANEQFCFSYWRQVAHDHTIALFGQTLSLPPLSARLNLAGRRVELRQRMDGRLALLYQDEVLGLFQPAQLGPPQLEQFEPAPYHLAKRPATAPQPSPAAAPTNRIWPKAPPNHPWRGPHHRQFLASKAADKQKK